MCPRASRLAWLQGKSAPRGGLPQADRGPREAGWGGPGAGRGGLAAGWRGCALVGAASSRQSTTLELRLLQDPPPVDAARWGGASGGRGLQLASAASLCLCDWS